MHKSGNWDHLRYVLAVARAGSVNRAAAELGVNHATVLRHVAAFEQDAGMEIFEKTATGYRVRPDRQELIEAARDVEDAMQSVSRRLRGMQAPLHGRVRVTSTDSFCQLVLPPALLALRGQLGNLRIDLLSSNAYLDFARMHADITVRPTPKLAEGMTGTVVAQLGFGVFATPGCPDDLWIAPGGGLADSQPGIWMRENIADEHVAGSADSFMSLCQIAAAGGGQAVLPVVVGVNDSRLQRRDGILPEMSVDIWVASHSDLADVPRISVVRRQLAAELRRDAARLSGS